MAPMASAAVALLPPAVAPTYPTVAVALAASVAPIPTAPMATPAAAITPVSAGVGLDARGSAARETPLLQFAVLPVRSASATVPARPIVTLASAPADATSVATHTCVVL